jgi:hypothetical protein
MELGVNAMLVVVLPSVLNLCCCCVVVSILPSEKAIVLNHPMKIAPVIITRIYRKDRNDRIGFVTSTLTPVQSTSYLFHGYSI